MFIHDTILDHIKCGVNEVEATQITIEIRQLSEKNIKGRTGFEEKFQVLNLEDFLLDFELPWAFFLGFQSKTNKYECIVIVRFYFFLKRLNNISPKINPEHCEAALLPKNKTKNRNPEIYPCMFFTNMN